MQDKKPLRSKIQTRLKNLFSLFKKMVFIRENKTFVYSVLILIGVLLITLAVFLIFKALNQEGVIDPDLQKEVFAPQTQPIEPLSLQEGPITSVKDFYTKPKGELSELIQKANILYDNGRVDEALEIFKNISLYSQSLANYNLGVIYAGEKDFSLAKKKFEDAIEGGDDVALSSINAAYSALRMKDEKSFAHFLRLAEQTLSDSARTPFYSYLYGLVSFYKNQYFESLSPLLNPNSSNYQVQNNALASEMFLVLGDDYNALQYLKKDHSNQNMLALGMLYARNGDYESARDKIQTYLLHYPDNQEAISALELVELKLGNFSESANLLMSLKNQKPFFKIQVELDPYLFDIQEAQKRFWDTKFESRQSLQYKILFYYAPYRVFDAQQVFQFLSDGGFEWSVGNIDEASDSYARGEIFSRINRDIAQGLKEVYSGDLRKALQIFLKKVKTHAQHPVLYYNIGLVYAQLGDFENAHLYFSRAYYLDNTDLMAGIFAIMTGKITYQNVSKMTEMLGGDFLRVDFKDEDQRMFLHELFSYAKGKVSEAFDFVNQFKNPKPIHFALQAIYAMGQGDQEKISQYFALLKQKLPKDLTTDMMYQVARNYKGNLKDISLEFSGFFRKGSFSDMHSLYYGGSLTRELYIYLAFVTGNLSFVITHLQDKLTTQEASPVGIMQALGLAYIYNQEFEKAFVIYNDLIDGLKQADSATKFMGAVAAIGSGHHNNAVALLQISKIDSSATLESRYALALLYQQEGNIKSAISLFQGIAKKGFVSEFFDFRIDTSEILEKAQQ